MKTLRMIALCATAIFSGCTTTAAFAQAAKPAAPVTAPAPVKTVPLSSTETAAIRSLAKELQANQKEHDELLASIPQTVAQKIVANQSERDGLLALVKQIEAEIVAEHPGYHFDEQSGSIVQDAPKSDVKTGVK